MKYFLTEVENVLTFYSNRADCSFPRVNCEVQEVSRYSLASLYSPAQLLAIAITLTRESAEPRGHHWPDGHTVLIATSPLQPHTVREAGRITQWTAFLRCGVNLIKIPAAKLDTVIVLQEKSDHVVWAEASKSSAKQSE